MAPQTLLLVFAVALSNTVEVSLGSGVLTIRLTGFTNPFGRTYDGACCDPTPRDRGSACYDQCDYVMRLIVTGLGRANDHVFLFHRPLTYDSNNIIFENGDSNLLLTVLFDEWPEDDHVKMNAFFYDYDDFDHTTTLVDWFETDLRHYKKNYPAIDLDDAWGTFQEQTVVGNRRSDKTVLTFEWSALNHDNAKPAAVTDATNMVREESTKRTRFSTSRKPIHDLQKAWATSGEAASKQPGLRTTISDSHTSSLKSKQSQKMELLKSLYPKEAEDARSIIEKLQDNTYGDNFVTKTSQWEDDRETTSALNDNQNYKRELLQRTFVDDENKKEANNHPDIIPRKSARPLQVAGLAPEAGQESRSKNEIYFAYDDQANQLSRSTFNNYRYPVGRYNTSPLQSRHFAGYGSKHKGVMEIANRHSISDSRFNKNNKNDDNDNALSLNQARTRTQSHVGKAHNSKHIKLPRVNEDLRIMKLHRKMFQASRRPTHHSDVMEPVKPAINAAAASRYRGHEEESELSKHHLQKDDTYLVAAVGREVRANAAHSPKTASVGNNKTPATMNSDRGENSEITFLSTRLPQKKDHNYNKHSFYGLKNQQNDTQMISKSDSSEETKLSLLNSDMQNQRASSKTTIWTKTAPFLTTTSSPVVISSSTTQASRDIANSQLDSLSSDVKRDLLTSRATFITHRRAEETNKSRDENKVENASTASDARRNILAAIRRESNKTMTKDMNVDTASLTSKLHKRPVITSTEKSSALLHSPAGTNQANILLNNSWSSKEPLSGSQSSPSEPLPQTNNFINAAASADRLRSVHAAQKNLHTPANNVTSSRANRSFATSKEHGTWNNIFTESSDTTRSPIQTDPKRVYSSTTTLNLERHHNIPRGNVPRTWQSGSVRSRKADIRMNRTSDSTETAESGSSSSEPKAITEIISWPKSDAIFTTTGHGVITKQLGSARKDTINDEKFTLLSDQDKSDNEQMKNDHIYNSSRSVTTEVLTTIGQIDDIYRPESGIVTTKRNSTHFTSLQVLLGSRLENDSFHLPADEQDQDKVDLNATGVVQRSYKPKHKTQKPPTGGELLHNSIKSLKSFRFQTHAPVEWYVTAPPVISRKPVLDSTLLDKRSPSTVVNKEIALKTLSQQLNTFSLNNKSNKDLNAEKANFTSYVTTARQDFDSVDGSKDLDETDLHRLMPYNRSKNQITNNPGLLQQPHTKSVYKHNDSSNTANMRQQPTLSFDEQSSQESTQKSHLNATPVRHTKLKAETTVLDTTVKSARSAETISRTSNQKTSASYFGQSHNIETTPEALKESEIPEDARHGLLESTLKPHRSVGVSGEDSPRKQDSTGFSHDLVSDKVNIKQPSAISSDETNKLNNQTIKQSFTVKSSNSNLAPDEKTHELQPFNQSTETGIKFNQPDLTVLDHLQGSPPSVRESPSKFDYSQKDHLIANKNVGTIELFSKQNVTRETKQSFETEFQSLQKSQHEKPETGSRLQQEGQGMEEIESQKISTNLSSDVGKKIPNERNSSIQTVFYTTFTPSTLLSYTKDASLETDSSNEKWQQIYRGHLNNTKNVNYETENQMISENTQTSFPRQPSKTKSFLLNGENSKPSFQSIGSLVSEIEIKNVKTESRNNSLEQTTELTKDNREMDNDSVSEFGKRKLSNTQLISTEPTEEEVTNTTQAKLLRTLGRNEWKRINTSLHSTSDLPGAMMKPKHDVHDLDKTDFVSNDIRKLDRSVSHNQSNIHYKWNFTTARPEIQTLQKLLSYIMTKETRQPGESRDAVPQSNTNIAPQSATDKPDSDKKLAAINTSWGDKLSKKQLHRDSFNNLAETEASEDKHNKIKYITDGTAKVTFVLDLVNETSNIYSGVRFSKSAKASLNNHTKHSLKEKHHANHLPSDSKREESEARFVTDLLQTDSKYSQINTSFNAKTSVSNRYKLPNTNRTTESVESVTTRPPTNSGKNIIMKNITSINTHSKKRTGAANIIHTTSAPSAIGYKNERNVLKQMKSSISVRKIQQTNITIQPAINSNPKPGETTEISPANLTRVTHPASTQNKSSPDSFHMMSVSMVKNNSLSAILHVKNHQETALLKNRNRSFTKSPVPAQTNETLPRYNGFITDMRDSLSSQPLVSAGNVSSPTGQRFSTKSQGHDGAEKTKTSSQTKEKTGVLVSNTKPGFPRDFQNLRLVTETIKNLKHASNKDTNQTSQFHSFTTPPLTTALTNAALKHALTTEAVVTENNSTTKTNTSTTSRRSDLLKMLTTSETKQSSSTFSSRIFPAMTTSFAPVTTKIGSYENKMKQLSAILSSKPGKEGHQEQRNKVLNKILAPDFDKADTKIFFSAGHDLDVPPEEKMLTDPEFSVYSFMNTLPEHGFVLHTPPTREIIRKPSIHSPAGLPLPKLSRWENSARRHLIHRKMNLDKFRSYILGIRHGPTVKVPVHGLYTPGHDNNSTNSEEKVAKLPSPVRRHGNFYTSISNVGTVFTRYWPAVLGVVFGTIFLLTALVTSLLCRQRRLLVQRARWSDSPQHVTEPPDTSEYTSSSESSVASELTRSSINLM